jgi:hypothetical protein
MEHCSKKRVALALVLISARGLRKGGMLPLGVTAGKGDVPLAFLGQIQGGKLRDAR